MTTAEHYWTDPDTGAAVCVFPMFSWSDRNARCDCVYMVDDGRELIWLEQVSIVDLDGISWEQAMIALLSRDGLEERHWFSRLDYVHPDTAEHVGERLLQLFTRRFGEVRVVLQFSSGAELEKSSGTYLQS